MEEWYCDEMSLTKKISYMYEFVEVSSFVAVLSSDSNEPVLFVRIEEKVVAENELRDQLREVI